jgi:hypothetical protein
VDVAHRHAVERLLLGEVRVQQPERPDRCAAEVGEQGVGDAALLGEGGQDVDGVVADGEERDAGALEVGRAVLQLDQLRLAVRSPARAAVEDNQCASTPARAV